MRSVILFFLAVLCLACPVYADEKIDEQLICAVVTGNYPLFHKSLTAGANVNAQSGEGVTVLMLATLHERESMVKALLAHKADITSKTKQGSAVMNYAVNSNNPIFRILIAAGADVNAQGNVFSPLQKSAMTNRPDRIDMLIAADANINLENFRGESALYYAALKGHTACIQKLIEKKADCVSPVMRAVSGGEPDKWMAELLQNLFDAGVSVNLTDPKGRTALMLAAKNGKNLCLKTLLANKADVKIKDKSGKTALDYAKESLNSDGLKLLQKAQQPR